MALQGKTVAITRPENQARELSEFILREGGKPFLAPTVEIKPPKAKKKTEIFAQKIVRCEIDYVIFMSVNGVQGLFNIAKEMGLKGEMLDALNQTVVVAVGPKTKDELEKWGVKVKLVPEDYSSQGLIESLARISLRGKTVALPRTGGVSPYLKRKLEELGVKVVQVPVYRSTLPFDKSRVLKLIHGLFEGKIDAITFTSSATARNLFHIAREKGLTEKLRESFKRNKITVLAIGLKTQMTLEKLGVKVQVTPQQSTIEAMMKAYIVYLKG